MSKGFFNSLSNFVTDSVYTATRAAFAVGSLGLSEILLEDMHHESPMERREQLELEYKGLLKLEKAIDELQKTTSELEKKCIK